MKAVIYARVSKDARRQERSVTEQEAECRAFCAEHGWDVAAVRVDNDRSASRYARADRPAWDVLMGELSRYDVLVTWEASRATRNLEVYAQLRNRCRDAGVLWAYSGRVYDLSRADDAFMTGLEMLTAERSSEDTAVRIQRTVKSQAVKGKPHGRIPFGYRREYDPQTGALVRQVPDEVEAPIIREIAARVLDGESLYGITKDLARREIPGLKVQQLETPRVRRILTNPTYAGLRVYRGEVIGEADWEPIITREQFEALRGVLNGPRFERYKFHGSAPKHLLSGIAVCGVCGGRIARLPSNNRNSARYVCKKHCVAIRQEWADTLVNAVIVQRLNQPDALELVNQPAGDDVTALAADVRTLEQRLEGFYVEAASGALSPRGLAAVEQQLTEQIDAKRAEIQRTSTPMMPTIPDPAALAANWDTADVRDRRMIVQALMDVTIHRASVPGRRGFEPERVKITWKGDSA